MDTILSRRSVSVTELKRDFANVLKAADDEPVAVLNHNRPEAYLVPAAHYERLLTQLEDLQDLQLARERADGPFVKVALDEL
ncbi:MAG: type II toxin-antitoxin system prevent-host-death family antitoxin [Hydrogenophaga sp.]|uniref:type II toxin-antitoxin system Phd/YefM family antitoxin n=1 Tax=Hydrogenophaga sp. TaxID=1904254 RepID=UPI0016A6FE55|nr:type II toxin-antitoxin system Phd/YefM family antitoxin [Hydrogenophaga sp.]NIM41878.1 type II toxin-antitoxin system prevent-host-death family antitoxin [Hydrogenophaga sp.]NIN27183.1 type II toxin-antitoxin system prevent-host-death family antitoxin [Hydrogenophaga sp.]NIN31884.1 type II toxin-antitoxin system prevent-host-death family antitoxin [Hydrogenophaga sp.]NIN56128.1 type II toxin-antitoxin system prevent-host-death family antitoxin [Hydrogenophaga sp.]NIO52255.1 type II toxin-a